MTPGDLRALLAAGTGTPWVHDSRTGMTTVCSGEKRDCLAGLEAIARHDGKWDADEQRWDLPPEHDRNFALIVAAVNHLGALLDVVEAAADEHDGGCDDDECATCTALAALEHCR